MHCCRLQRRIFSVATVTWHLCMGEREIRRDPHTSAAPPSQVTETALTAQARALDPVGAKQMQGEHPPLSVDRVRAWPLHAHYNPVQKLVHVQINPLALRALHESAVSAPGACHQ